MTKLDKIQHPSHAEHPLRHKLMKTLYECDGCKQLGHGKCYQCEQCNVQLHEECARARDGAAITHPFFPKRSLVFRAHPPDNVWFCEACGDSVRGHRYEARPRNLLLRPLQHLSTRRFLHPCCANLPPSLSSNDGSGLELKLDKNKRRTSGCKICNNASYSRGVKGWAYASSCGRFIYHVACVNRRMEEEWRRKSPKKPGRKIGLEAAANLAVELIVSVILGFHSIPLGGLVRSLLDEN